MKRKRGASSETSNPASPSERGIRAVPSQRDAVDTISTLRFMRYSSGTSAPRWDAAGASMAANPARAMKRTDRAALIALAILAASGAQAGDDAPREWAASCLSCHQPGSQRIPLLYGQTREALLSKLRAFRDQALPGTVMPQLAKGYSDAQIEAIAGWFAAASSSSR